MKLKVFKETFGTVNVKSKWLYYVGGTLFATKHVTMWSAVECVKWSRIILCYVHVECWFRV
jgi:hypothetical protein